MAALPCDHCQEETVVLSHSGPGLDARDQTVYRRFRTCINPRCEMFEIRRETVEVFLPLKEKRKASRKELRSRLSRSAGSQPSLFET